MKKILSVLSLTLLFSSCFAESSFDYEIIRFGWGNGYVKKVKVLGETYCYYKDGHGAVKIDCKKFDRMKRRKDNEKI